MEWFKKKMRVFLFVCLLFPFYSYAAKISLSISGKIEDHSAMLYFPDWENRVRAGLKGIQLHFVNGDTFMNDYMIKGIPRFILLDKEGKIISVDMSRPSDPKTIAKLDELLN